MTKHLSLIINNNTLVTPAFELVVFSKQSFAIDPSPLIQFIQTFFETFGEQIQYYQTSEMRAAEKFVIGDFQSLIHLMKSKLKNKNSAFSVDLNSSPNPNLALAPALEIFCDENNNSPYSYFRIVFPPHFFKSKTENIMTYLNAAIAPNFASSGWLGYTFHWRVLDPYNNERITKAIRPWLLNSPGLSQGDHQELAELARLGIVGINWITILGSELNKKLGGTAKLNKRIKPSSTIRLKLKNDLLLLLAGEKPRFGNTKKNQYLPVYKEVGKLLRGVKAPLDEAWIEGFEGDEMENWLSRFF